LLQESIASQRRKITRALPQVLLTVSLKVRVTALQVSDAVAVPVALVAMLVPHSTMMFVGGTSTGGAMSRTVMVWTQVELLPHGSVARQVREMTFALPQLVLVESLNVIVGVPQVSVAVATPVAFVVVTAGQSRVRFVGHVMTGAVVSMIVTI
jgi:hypothetical protein